MRTVRVRYQYTHMCPFCEAVKYLVEMLREAGLEVVEEPLDVGIEKSSMNVEVINRKLLKEGKGILPIKQWVPCLVLELIEDDEVKGRIIINVEEYVEIGNQKYPCRSPYVQIGKYAEELLEEARDTYLDIEDIIKQLDNMFGIRWRVGYMCLRRYREIVHKILKIVTAWVRGGKKR